MASAEPPTTPPDTRHVTEPPLSTIDTTAVLAALSDDYTQSILEVLADRPTAAPVLANEIDASRPTVYRRLNTLEAAGVVESTLTVDPDGHHRKRFHLLLDSVELTFDANGIEINAVS